jgi:hypothetical protein
VIISDYSQLTVGASYRFKDSMVIVTLKSEKGRYDGFFIPAGGHIFVSPKDRVARIQHEELLRIIAEGEMEQV